MGGCATKPKVLKSDDTREAPAPVTEPAKDETAVAEAGADTGVVVVPDDLKENKEVVVSDQTEKKKDEGDDDHVIHGADDDRIKEIADDEQETKHRSLSNLFKEEFHITFLIVSLNFFNILQNEEAKDSTQDEKTPVIKPEPIVEAEAESKVIETHASKPEPSQSEPEIPTGESESKAPEPPVEPELPAPLESENPTTESEISKVQEIQVSETAVEETAAIEANNAPEEKTKTEEVTEGATAAETHGKEATLEKSSGEKEVEKSGEENSKEVVVPEEKTLDAKGNVEEIAKV
ncbi:hypothetical protein FEM48_Zijuj08G0183200 [Ziziphus jujuba var. spinosa]|uniref:Uncharacterized protein n=1 Tax=Ziziphus jujuba var. spinosa TaxID=714518 RepID=A0A978V0M3_ZIZJJ|nr:hypothetical protein FEM48_Zijuj08G0183200 [Ziziphus jujuba var. spinosa]